tara:strand:- start:147 stop:1547 length:1401 start_codon:yes stop_codon:yes gene_type:complete
MKDTIDLNNRKNIHFIGIGGIGMSAIAELCNINGLSVQGSDIRHNDSIRKLKSKGINVFIGHKPSNIKNADLVIYSSAIDNENPELISAIQKNIQVLSRGQILAQLMKSKKCISITGTHGKTTTTSMTSWLLSSSSNRPTSLVGGIENFSNSNLQIGNGDWMVVEADESDKTFLNLPSKISVITNIDHDHLDTYGSYENLEESFIEYSNNIKEDDYLIICKDDSGLNKIIRKLTTKNIITYGESSDATIRVCDIVSKNFGSTFSLRGKIDKHDVDLEIEIRAPGKHNILNATAASIVALILEIPNRTISQRFIEYQGVYRRLSMLLDKNGIKYFDDYAHHPTEIKKLLSSIKKIGSGRVISVFQPHRYSRFFSLYDLFCECFNDADQLYIMPIYPAGEKEIPNIKYNKIAQEISDASKINVSMVSSEEILFNLIIKFAKAGDIVLFIGAGDINLLSKKICNRISKS